MKKLLERILILPIRFYQLAIQVDNLMERTKFILASYNAGPAHILDARALAAKYGENPNQWAVAEKYLMLKSEPEYYNDTVCTFGYFRGNHTVRYVKDVFDTYNSYLEKTNPHND